MACIAWLHLTSVLFHTELLSVLREVPLTVFAGLIKEIDDNSTESAEPATYSRFERE